MPPSFPNPPRLPVQRLIDRLSQHAVAMALVAAFLGSRLTLADFSPIELQTFKTHSRLVVRIDEGVDALWKDRQGGFELLLKGVSLTDLGAPLGAEEEWLKSRTGLSDGRLASIQVHESRDGVVIDGKWKFASGKRAPADATMERFEYRQKSPAPSWVVDFWPKGGLTVGEAQAKKSQLEGAARQKSAQEEAKRRRDRRIASEKARADRDDLGKFCRQPSTAKNDVFLPFLPARESLDLGRWFPQGTADSGYLYLEPQGSAKDAQYVRLAVNLHRQNKPALCLRTIEFFEKEHPGSDYRFEMRFLQANALAKLGRDDEALRILDTLTKDAKSSPAALHAAMYLAGKSFSKKQYLQALESFLWLIANHPEHRLAWVFHLGAGEAQASMKQTERAAREYQWVAENAPDADSKAMGAFRLGDLYLDRRQYEQGLAAYYRALQGFPVQAQTSPLPNLNRAEALYWLGDGQRAEEAFREFAEKFRAHPEGWRATLRLGEIELGRAGHSDSARKWFVETINRYPYSAGATLARLRLLPCGDHGGMNADSVLRFFSGDVEAFAVKALDSVSMQSFADLKGLALIRSLIAFGREEQAVEAAIHELRSNPSSSVRPVVGDLLQVVFRKKILAELDRGKGFDALKFYQDNVAGLPQVEPGQSEADPDYLLRLARAAEDLGLPSLAKRLSEIYAKASGAADGEAGGRAVASGDPVAKAPALDADARLKDSEKAFTEARAIWATLAGASGELPEGAVAKLKVLLGRVTEESEFGYGREILLGLMEERAGKPASALAHATRAQLLIPKGALGDAARIAYWVTALQARAGEARAAAEGYGKLAKSGSAQATDDHGLARALGVPAALGAVELVFAQGDLLGSQARWGEAAAAYGRLVEEGQGDGRAMYEYARALGKTGAAADHVKSIEILKKLAAEGDAERLPAASGGAGRNAASPATSGTANVPAATQNLFWKKLAREALANRETTAKEGRP